MSLLVTSVLVASGVLLGRWIAKGGREGARREDEARASGERKEEDKEDREDKEDKRDKAGRSGAEGHREQRGAPRQGAEENASVKDAPPKPPKARAPSRDPFEDLPCKLGDVIMRAGGDEAWLAGAVLFSEQDPVSALFVAPEAGKDRAIYARARPGTQLSWLEPVSAGEIALGAEPPTSIEHAGVRYERARRLPVKVTRFGSGAPDLGEQVIVAEYASAGFERLVVVTGSGAARAWVGIALDEGMYEVLPSGKTTLES